MAERPATNTLLDRILSLEKRLRESVLKIQGLEQELADARRDLENEKAETYLRTMDFLKGMMPVAVENIGHCICKECLSVSPLNQRQQLPDPSVVSDDSGPGKRV